MTPDAVKLWINTVFRHAVHEVCANPETLALIKVGRDQGHSLERILANVVSAVVLEIAGMKPEEWD